MQCPMQIDNVQRLGDGQRSEVVALVEAATHVDRVAPLSEQALLDARSHAADSTSPDPRWPHFLARSGAQLTGYAHLQAGAADEAATAEVVVDPAHRRRGVGTALIRALEDALKPQDQTLRLWSHGHIDSARRFARRDGYSIVRELWQMRRSLRSDVAPLPAARLPEGFTTRHFVVGRDEDAWLRVNAKAFADHPEQGRMTRRDLDRRIAEPWFDARGFILVEDTRGLAPILAASHWTKVEAVEDPKTQPNRGEVYVVGVDPAYQGLGLGQAVTVLGLAYLREQLLSEATLYVDADNRAAVATYSRLGFTRCAVDVMYSRAVQTPVSG
jgi:mycothiol synthase